MKLKDTRFLFHFLCVCFIWVFSSVFLPVIISFMVINISQLTQAGEQASGFLTPRILFILLGTVKRGYFDQNFSNKLVLHTFVVFFFNSELKPTWTLKVQPLKSHGFGIKANTKMIDIVPGKWGYFDQIIFNANKTAFGSLFCFSQAPTILSHIIPRPSKLLEARSQPGYIVKRTLETKSTRTLSLFWFIFESSFEVVNRNKSLTILLEESLNVISLLIIKIKVI